MRGSTVLLLSRPSSRTGRARARLLATAVGVDGALVLWAQRVARVRGELSDLDTGLAPLVAESGLRIGTAVGGLMLCIPVGALFLQGLRVGATARARGLATLRLAGATPGEVRRLASLETARAALFGGVLAGPAYVGLWLIVGVLAPKGTRLVPTPDLMDLGAWLLVVVLGAAAGGIAGAWVHRQVIA